MKPDKTYYILRWVSGFTDILDGLCVIFTLGCYHPMLSMKLMSYDAKRLLKKFPGDAGYI